MSCSTDTTTANSVPTTDEDRAKAIIATLPPTEMRCPNSPDDSTADAHNTAILAVRGLQTTATIFQLAQLAKIAAMNRNIAIGENTPPTDVSNSKKQDRKSSKYKEAFVTTFEPFYFFFYGSLQDPMVLTSVCNLLGEDNNDVINDKTKDEIVVLRQSASIKGWKVRMWGPYPALVPATDENNRVKGVAWLCEKYDHVKRLCNYETSAYRMAYCDIEVPTADGNGVEVIKNARTFVSTLDANDEDLKDGEFVLKEYQNGLGEWWS
ncbi:hypothetical protein F5Y01DRAFT_324922 [Xylaria sp. FL0043]|nr:hypothetical protein F5Y01DRAFT_324922 [Xylaria sp. FL0043]